MHPRQNPGYAYAWGPWAYVSPPPPDRRGEHGGPSTGSGGVCNSLWNVSKRAVQDTSSRFSSHKHLSLTTHLQSSPKMAQFFWYALTSSNINWFLKLFHCQNQEKMCNNTTTKDPTTPQVCRYTTLWNVKCLQSNNWKQDDFCNNTLKN